jgi:hypothetical protein
MSQHDMVIANDTAPNVRSDINNALGALVSNNSGATEPASTFAYQLWADTTTGLLKIRNAANSGWVTIGLLSNLWASPGTIGSTTPNTGAFTTLSATGKISSGDDATYDLNVKSAAASSTNCIANIISGNAAVSALYFSDTDANAKGRLTYQHSDDTLHLFVNSLDRYTFSDSGLAISGNASTTGLLLAGTTTDGAGAGTGVHRATFDGAGVGAAAMLKGIATAATTATNIWNPATSGDNIFTQWYTEGGAGTVRGTVDYNRGGGLVRYNTSSDATLKNVLGDAPVEVSLEILRATRMRHYAWKDDPTQKLQLGPIAQELHEVFKGAVSVGGLRDVMEAVYEDVYEEVDEDVIEDLIGDITEPVFEDAFNKDGEKIGVVQVGERVVGQGVIGQVKTGTRRVMQVVGRKQVGERKIGERYQPWGVDKTAFSFHLVVGFQYLDAETQALKAELAALKARIAALEAR